MTLSEYLKGVDGILKRQEQQAWLEKLEKGARKGFQLFESVDEDVRLKGSSIFQNKVRTENKISENNKDYAPQYIIY